MFTLLILIIIIGGFAFVVSKQPEEFRVARTATLPASPATVFEQVNTLPNWHAWSPWARLDPNCVTTFEGPEAGNGAVMRWEGNNKVGKGSMTILESRPNELIKFRLDFLKPMVATNTAEFTFKPVGSQTEVMWSMLGKNNFIGKAMMLVMNCEKMVGGNFEQGFANLKTVLEAKKP